MKPIFGVANAEKATRSQKVAKPRCFSELFRLLKNASLDSSRRYIVLSVVV